MPELTDEEAQDVYLLWRHGGEDPERTVVRPAWVVSLLVGGLRSEMGEQTESPVGDPFDDVPEGLRGL